MKQHELDLDSSVFTGVRMMLSDKIVDTIKDMKAKGLSSGSVSLKIKIGIMECPDENGEFQSTVIFEPKISSRIEKTQEEKVGASGGRIEIDRDGRILIGTNQIDIDELLDEQNKKGA